MKLENFLPQDQFKALEETTCVKNCLFAITTFVGNSDYDSALYALEHARRSLIELQKLKSDKEFNDKLNSLATEFRKAGMEI